MALARVLREKHSLSEEHILLGSRSFYASSANRLLLKELLLPVPFHREGDRDSERSHSNYNRTPGFAFPKSDSRVVILCTCLSSPRMCQLTQPPGPSAGAVSCHSPPSPVLYPCHQGGITLCSTAGSIRHPRSCVECSYGRLCHTVDHGIHRPGVSPVSALPWAVLIFSLCVAEKLLGLLWCCNDGRPLSHTGQLVVTAQCGAFVSTWSFM